MKNGVDIYFYFLLIDFGEREINLLFHLVKHSLVDSCMCPDWVSNPHLWGIRTMLQPIELPDQGLRQREREREREMGDGGFWVERGAVRSQILGVKFEILTEHQNRV